MTASPDNGIMTVHAQGSVDEIVRKVEALLEAKGVKLFAVIDHSGEAAKAGLEMPDTKVLIFGNPKGGTPLMLASPSIALDLPLKILVAQHGEDHVAISFNTPEYLRHRHNLPAELAAVLAAAPVFAQQAGQ
jgi:uncharacterized protein (DUF302 family)